VILAITAYAEDSMERGYMKHGTGFAGTFREFPVAIMEFPRRIMELFPGSLDYFVLGVLAATTLGFLLWKGTRAPEDDAQERADLYSILWVMGLLYVCLPYSMAKPMSWWNISPRLPSMMAPVLLLLPAARLTGWQRWLMAPVVISCVVLPLKLSSLYRDFSQRNAPFMKMLAQVPRGANTLVVVRKMFNSPHPEESSGDPAVSAPTYWHFPSWPMALNGGYGPYVFDQGIPIQPRKHKKLPFAPNWGAGDTFVLRQARDFEYLIIRFPPPELDRDPAVEAIDRKGDWALYQRIHALPENDEP
jgi:hypothetical protein